jgi:hypothetical protein
MKYPNARGIYDQSGVWIRKHKLAKHIAHVRCVELIIIQKEYRICKKEKWWFSVARKPPTPP